MNDLPKNTKQNPGLEIKDVLRVVSAFPDPPFEIPGKLNTGFDMDLIQAIAKELGFRLDINHYEGADFNGIFKGLKSGIFDIVISGTTVTPQREKLVRFCSPYLRSGQSLVINIGHRPSINSIDDLQGEIIGVQLGNTSEPIAMQLKAQGKVADVRIYDYNQILKALDDLESEQISAFMKLEPVMRWLTKDRSRLKVVQTGITNELLAIAVHIENEQLAKAIEKAQKAIAARGELHALGKKWLFSCDPKTTGLLL